MTDKKENPHPVGRVRVCLQKGGTTLPHKKHTKNRAKLQRKRTPQKAKTLKNVKSKVEFWAAIVTIIAGVIAILVSILK
jgi:hypothetical protein